MSILLLILFIILFTIISIFVALTIKELINNKGDE